MQTGYKIMDIMTNKPVTAPKDMILKDAAALMEKEDVNSILIVEDDRPVGIITDEDIVRKCVAKGCDAKKLKIKDIASVELTTITPEKDVFEALTLMRDRSVRQLPVVNKGKIVGFLTLKAILKIQPDLIDLWIEKYEIRGDSDRMRELERTADGDGAEGFFKKLKLKKIQKKVNKKR